MSFSNSGMQDLKGNSVAISSKSNNHIEAFSLAGDGVGGVGQWLVVVVVVVMVEEVGWWMWDGGHSCSSSSYGCGCGDRIVVDVVVDSGVGGGA